MQEQDSLSHMTNCAVLYIARNHKTRINLWYELHCDAHNW